MGTQTSSERRVCILGTAPTWRDAPFGDPSVEIWALNDSHVLKLPRADRWYDLHPFDKFYFRDPSKPLRAQDVPPGSFIRPNGHLEFLKRQTIPVFVQNAAALGSPSAQTLPKAEIEKAVGPYFASSPAWMVGHALMEGVTDLFVYGIHLATEWEYLRQKPNMSFLLGIAAGRGVRLHIPETAPLLRESHQYAYQPDPDVPKLIVKQKIAALQGELATIEQRIQSEPWWKRDPNLRSRKAWVSAQIGDANLELQAVIASRSPVGV